MSHQSGGKPRLLPPCRTHWRPCRFVRLDDGQVDRAALAPDLPWCAIRTAKAWPTLLGSRR
jgi:hypothetical protein